ncbi:MAG: TadE/TadG family type IV pilus assembly protein [Pseudomonadota bacterium]
MNLREKLSRLIRNEEGAVSVEFVLVFPILALWLGASFVWFDAFRAKSQMSKIAYTISDIASRFDDETTEADLEELFLTHKLLLPQRRTSEGWLRVSSICFNGTDYRVLWSYLGDDTYLEAIADPDDEIDPRLLPLSEADIPLNLMPTMSDNDSIIMTDVYSYWEPIVSWAGFEPTDLNVSLVERPRFFRIIPVVGGLAGYPNADEGTLCPEGAPPPVI